MASDPIRSSNPSSTIAAAAMGAAGGPEPISLALFKDAKLDARFEEALAQAKERIPDPFLQRVELASIGGQLGMLFAFHDAAQGEWYAVRLMPDGSTRWKDEASLPPRDELLPVTKSLAGVAVSPEQAFARARELFPDALFSSMSLTPRADGKLEYHAWHTTEWRHHPNVAIDAATKDVRAERFDEAQQKMVPLVLTGAPASDRIDAAPAAERAAQAQALPLVKSKVGPTRSITDQIASLRAR